MDGSASNLKPARPQMHDVLIVEDERVARRAMASLLASSGYRPAAFESAEEALAELERDAPPPLVLVDVDLPGMSGLDLVERLEKIRPDLKAVVITAADNDRIERFCQGHRCTYMRKPVDFPRLLDVLHRHGMPYQRDRRVQ